MAGLNKITIIGNLGGDPEMRYLPSGSPVTNFNVAVTRRWRGRDGEDHEETEWFRVAAFDRLAEVANEYLAKGKQVYIEGHATTSTWLDRQTNEPRARIEVRATTLLMLGARGEQGSEHGYNQQPYGGRQEIAPENADFENMPF